MTTMRDIRGNPLSGASHAGAAAYSEGLEQVNLYVGDHVASAEVATAEAPGFIMAHVLRAWLYFSSALRLQHKRRLAKRGWRRRTRP
jgi:hypothetical protein